MALLVLASLLAACAPNPPWREESYAFGTRIELLIHGETPEHAAQAGAEVLREFDRLHRRFHAWQDSELTALNSAIAAGQGHQVSAELAGYIRQAQDLARRGGYLFEPGIGRLIGLWGFQSDALPTELPRTAAIDALVARHPSISDLSLEGNRVICRNRSVALDFGGYLKGLALDHAAGILRRQGVHNALINIGGNILALGSKGGTPWRVGIAHPRPEKVGGVPLASLDLQDGEAIGTSGDYHRYFEVDARRYFHVLDPRTGRPAWGTQAVTVLLPPGPDAGVRSDALSKPVFVAGAQWAAMAARLELAAVLRVADNGVIEVTPAMKSRLSFEAPDLRIIVRAGAQIPAQTPAPALVQSPS